MNSTPSPRPRHWLLLKSRQWHAWAGLVAALFLLVVGVTGAVLNYKKPIFHALGLDETKPVARPPRQESGPHYAQSDPLALPISFTQALATSSQQVGTGPIERIELKREGDTWLYKIKRKGASELWLNAVTGAHFTKGDYRKAALDKTAEPFAGAFDWGKLLLDLHTGKIGGPLGQALMTAVAVLLLALSASGLYMYLKPLLLRRARSQPGAVGSPALRSTKPSHPERCPEELSLPA
ncbi:MAG: PepSY domain-containing protein [Verrucomicrobia bacterium]|nr:PepSY domain-containing protein [Verrucomicrobiota bacterium]